MSEASLISTEKQAELLQSSDISKISLRNDEKSGAAHAAPPLPYGYSIARICSIRDCFFCLRIVHTDKISSIPKMCIRDRMAGVIAIVLIGGYIVIQSIFRISINDKIKSYGQLRTIGATPCLLYTSI